MIKVERSSERDWLQSDWALFLLVFASLAILYFPTSSVDLPNSIDPQTNALTAYLIAETGSPIAEGYEPAMEGEGRDLSLWLVESPGGPMTRYPPGTALIAVPIYWLASVDLTPVEIHPSGPSSSEFILLPEMWPAAIAASLATAAAVGLFALLFRDVGLSTRQAVIAAFVLGLGTALWSVAANALWQHGPAALAIGGGLLLVSRGGLEAAGLAFAAGILVRPQIAIIVAITGLTMSFAARSVLPAVRLGVTSAMGALVYVSYNLMFFDEILPNLSGGYAIRAASADIGSRLGAIVDTFLDGDRGLLVHSPVLIVALVAIPSGVRRAQPWMIGAAVGGLLYVLFQARPGDFSGGWGFWSYRYPLEGLVFAAPLLAVAVSEWVRAKPARIAALALSSAASIALHAFGTILIEL